MTGDIWVLAEQWRGRISEITHETLALGRELAGQAGVGLAAILVGHDLRRLADGLGKADWVLSLDHPLLAEPVAPVYADVLSPLLAERKPSALLIPLTNVSLGIGTLLSGLLQVPAVNFCRDVRFAEGRFRARCLLYGGKIEVEVGVSGEPAILGIWPGSRRPDKRQTAPPPVEEVAVYPEQKPAIRFHRYIEPEPGEVDLRKQDVLVAVGRGIQSEENMALAGRLAAALGGAVCGSRSVVDSGWLPLSRRIGKSGLTVKPKLYLALGISGTPEHVEGMRDSECVVAVNTDPGAPIFDLAHYGVVGDVVELLPALTGAIEARKAG